MTTKFPLEETFDLWRQNWAWSKEAKEDSALAMAAW